MQEIITNIKVIFQIDLASDKFLEENSNMDSNSNERDSLNHEPSPTQDKEKQYDGDNPNTISLESTESSSTCANAKGRY